MPLRPQRAPVLHVRPFSIYMAYTTCSVPDGERIGISNGAIGSKPVTYDFARLMEGATEIKCSEFGSNVIAHI